MSTVGGKDHSSIGWVTCQPTLDHLAILFFATEANAVRGCATPPSGLALLYGVMSATLPTRVVEIGGAHGVGSILMASAMQDAGTQGGRILCLEGMTVRAKIARDVAFRVGAAEVQVVEGLFQDTLADALSIGPELIFSDGDKGPELTKWHSAAALDSVRERGGWLFFDDINFNPEIHEIFLKVVDDHQVRWAVSFRDRWALLRVVSV